MCLLLRFNWLLLSAQNRVNLLHLIKFSFGCLRKYLLILFFLIILRLPSWKVVVINFVRSFSLVVITWNTTIILLFATHMHKGILSLQSTSLWTILIISTLWWSHMSIFFPHTLKITFQICLFVFWTYSLLQSSIFCGSQSIDRFKIFQYIFNLITYHLRLWNCHFVRFYIQIFGKSGSVPSEILIRNQGKRV